LGIIIHNTISEEAALGFSNKIKNTCNRFHKTGANDYITTGFTTLVVGIAKLGNVSAVGRIGEKP
jgi:Na+/H+-dicarboxylate symporter